MESKLFGYQHSSKYLLLCSTEESQSYKFETSKWWQNFHFCLNYPFKCQPFCRMDLWHPVQKWVEFCWMLGSKRVNERVPHRRRQSHCLTLPPLSTFNETITALRHWLGCLQQTPTLPFPKLGRKKNISLFMVHNPEIQENEVMELDMCHVLDVDFPSRKRKDDEGGKGIWRKSWG